MKFRRQQQQQRLSAFTWEERRRSDRPGGGGNHSVAVGGGGVRRRVGQRQRQRPRARSVLRQVVSPRTCFNRLLFIIAFVVTSAIDKLSSSVSSSGGHLRLVGGVQALRLLHRHHSAAFLTRCGRLSPRMSKAPIQQVFRTYRQRFQGPTTSSVAAERRRSLVLGASSSSESEAAAFSSSSMSASTSPTSSFRSAVKRAITSLWRRIVNRVKVKEGSVGGVVGRRKDDRTANAFEDADDDPESDGGIDDSPSFRHDDDAVVEDEDDVLLPVRIGNGSSPSVLSTLSSSATSLLPLPLPLPSLLVPPAPGSPSPSPSPPSPLLPSPTSISSTSSSPLGGVVGVMGQLEAFRGAQRTGAQTSQLLIELQNNVQVDASSYGNHVKVIMDGRQRIKSVELDEQFLKTAEPYEVSAAVVEALQLAHDKSVDKMDEKVKAFYGKLGLFGSGSGGGGGGGWIS